MRNLPTSLNFVEVLSISHQTAISLLFHSGAFPFVFHDLKYISREEHESYDSVKRDMKTANKDFELIKKLMRKKLEHEKY